MTNQPGLMKMKKDRFITLRCGMTVVHAVSADTSFKFGRHTHDQFGIGLIDRGAQVSMSERGMVEAKVGNVITVNPCEVHDGSPLGTESRSWRMLYSANRENRYPKINCACEGAH